MTREDTLSVCFRLTSTTAVKRRPKILTYEYKISTSLLNEIISLSKSTSLYFLGSLSDYSN